MSELFLQALNRSIAAGWLILAAAALRLLFGKAPKRLFCALWAAVAVRLLCPFSFKSALSLIPSAETVSPGILLSPDPSIHSGIASVDLAAAPVLRSLFAPSAAASVNPLQVWTALASLVWLAGMAAMAAAAAVSFLRLNKTVGASLPLRDGIRVCDGISTPFILGIVRPCVYLPSGLDAAQQAPVIAHESAHLRHRDHWWKPFGYLLLAVYWFNPLCWLAYSLFCRDLEMACDEAVIRRMDQDGLIAYSRALLACSLPRRTVRACPLAFGEVGVKQRIRRLLQYRKPSFWIVAAAVAACLAVSVCFLTDPKNDPSASAGGSLIRTYTYTGDSPVHTASVSLRADGTFEFVFSPLDSYMGSGQYRLGDGLLTLRTDDGRYTYVFDVRDGCLVFDAGASSAQTWLSGVGDGTVFR